MVLLNDKRLELVAQLEQARVVYEGFETDLAQRIADEKWEAKSNIRRLVREARAVGVPYRQIGFALKSSDHATIKNYENDVRR